MGQRHRISCFFDCPQDFLQKNSELGVMKSAIKFGTFEDVKKVSKTPNLPRSTNFDITVLEFVEI
jgi:hypothetical protein